MQFEKIGKYKIVGKIGQGAMGEVYKAQDTVLNRFVAIKTITASLGSDDQFRQRFHREAQSAAALQHRNIVTVFEFAEEKGMAYLVMELLQGVDLKDVLARGTLKRFEEKIAIVEQICDGLAFAHAKGVVHRDLKPANIHVLPNGTVKIMDFGLARLGVSEITRTGTVMGTPNYMSPEQVRGEKVDSRSDVFAVGAVMYEVLAGYKPFEAESMHSVLFQVLDQNPEPIRNRTPEIPPPVAAVVDRALAKDPADRFAAAGEMRAALRNARLVIATASHARAALGDDSDELVADDDPTLARVSGPAVPAEASGWATQGATALELSPVAKSQTAPRTARPHPTVVGAVAATSSGWLKAVGVLAVILVVAGGLLVWLRLRTGAGPQIAPAEVAREQERILRETLVASQVELARGQLDNKSYAEAIGQADRILALDNDNTAAQEIKTQAQAKLAELEQAAKDARTAFQRGDTDAASQKLARVMAIDPGHPVVAELSAALDRQFRGQANDARAEARKARSEAEKSRGQSMEGFASSDRSVAEAEGLLQGSQFVQATQKFLEARDGYARAARAAVAAAAAATRVAVAPGATPSVARPSLFPSQSPLASAPPSVAAPPSTGLPSATPIVPAPSATTAAVPGGDPGIHKVLADYARAIETKDLALFRSVKPALSGDEEKGLREFFKSTGVYKVGLTVDAVKVEGTEATVLVSRADFAGGKAMKPYRQSFKLAQRGGVWIIQSIGS